MAFYTILTENKDKGIALVADRESGTIRAWTGGKYYRVDDGRPVDGDGRQLREDSRAAIAEMLPIAQQNFDFLQDEHDTELNTAYNKGKEQGAEKPRTNFADALQAAFLQTLTEKASGDLVREIYPTIEKMVVEKFGILPQLHRVEIPERPPVELSGVLHEKFDIIMSMLMDGESVYLCGPAGTGKSFLAQQLAKAMQLEYFYTNSVTDDVQLKGFVDANGRYHETPFYKAFTEGGIFLLDEMDASIEDTLILLNNALANGYFAFPCGKKQAHKDFHCIAAGNTYGTGADSTYTGRTRLDASTLDRFAFIRVDYDRRIEKEMSQGDVSLVDFAHDFRNAVALCGMDLLFTYRAIKRLAKFSKYMEKTEALSVALVKGASADDIRMISNNMTVSNEWKTALDVLAKSM